ncbi:P protein-like [Haematobia irritans]|uniref:P protein-like n=1 Tax=Haematobia irritans TaxID=7368 RepID=UPI003F4FC7AC
MEDLQLENANIEIHANLQDSGEFSRDLCVTQNHYHRRLSGGSDSGISDEALSINEEPEEEPYRIKPLTKLHLRLRRIADQFRQGLLILSWLTLCYLLMVYEEKEYEPELLRISKGKATLHKINKDMRGVNMVVQLRGPFLKTTFRHMDVDEKFENLEKISNPLLSFVVQEIHKKQGEIRNISEIYYLPILNGSDLDGFTSLLKIEREVGNLTLDTSLYEYQLQFLTNVDAGLNLELFTSFAEVSSQMPLIWCLLLLTLIYGHIMFDLIHLTFAFVVASTLGIAIMAAVHLRPSLDEVYDFIEYEIIMAFFGISIIMEILAETGLQDYLAAYCYEMANGHIWPLLNVLFLSSCTLTAIMDEMTLILFLAPISLRICEIMHLDCTPVLSCLIIAINVGSLLTPSSSVTNYLIAHHKDLPMEHLKLGNFTLHMLPLTLLAMAQSYIHLRLQFINSSRFAAKEPLQLERLKRLTRVWRKVSDRMGGYSLDERSAKATVDTRISVGWIALLGALLTLSVCNYEDIEGILSRIPWATMLFLSCSFILMTTLTNMGLQQTLGIELELFLEKTQEKYRLTLAILSILWISSGLSCLLNNTPVVNLMIPVIVTLSHNEMLNLPIMPLIWSLVVGTCLGSNGSILAGIVNTACSGVASQHGYAMTNFGYFKVGFFVMLGNISLASCYLLLVHVVGHWH